MTKPCVWVDADACPVKEEIIAVVFRFELDLTFVSSQPIKSLMGRDRFSLILCEQGDDAVDDQLVELSLKGDLVVTADLILSKRLLSQGVTVINFQGRVLDSDAVIEGMGTRQVMLTQPEGKVCKKKKKAGKSKASMFKEGFHNVCAKRYSLKSD